MNSPKRRPYDQLVFAYDVRAAARTEFVAAVLGRTKLLAGAHVLDLGIGTGLLWEYIDSVGAPESIVGVDLSAGMLAQAHSRRNLKVQLLRADFAHLPFRLKHFDIVLLSFAARHAPDLAGTLRDAATVIVPHGHLFLIDYSGQTQMELSAVVMQCYALLGDTLNLEHAGKISQSYFAACREEDLLFAATEAGFRIERLSYGNVVEACGCEGVVDFVMNSPPIAFDLTRCHQSKRSEIRSRLIADCQDHLLPERVSSKIMFCLMSRTKKGMTYRDGYRVYRRNRI